MSNTQLDALLAEEPEAVQDEILRINTDARDRLTAGRAARARPRQPDRAAQLVPHGAPPGDHPLSVSRGHHAGLNRPPERTPGATH